MRHTTHFTQKGQSLVIIALAMVGFLAVLALVLDGGNAFAKRRSAQNAADAGALAGVRMLCEPDPDLPGTPAEQAQEMAVYYAVNRNGADPGPQVLVDEANKQVTVIAHIGVNTFFLHLVGIDQIPVQASATAGCFTPALGRSLIPTAWSCREPVPGWPTNSQGCQQQRITWDTLQGYLENPQVYPELYVVMDNRGLVDCNNTTQCLYSDMICKEDDPARGTLTCDLDGDGEIDWLGGGGRSWLDLDGTDPIHECNNTTSEGTTELREEIRGESDCEIPNDTWIPETRGDISALYADVQDRAATNPIVLVPVYDDFCRYGDPRYVPECNGTTPPGSDAKFLQGDDIYLTTASQPMYFRVDTFSIFYITCVRRNNGDNCPGATRVIERNPDTFGTGGNAGANFRSIEGYFLTGYVPGLSGRDDCVDDECPDLGIYTYYLSR